MTRGGLVFIGGADDALYAFDKETGKEIWSGALPPRTGPRLVGGHVTVNFPSGGYARAGRFLNPASAAVVRALDGVPYSAARSFAVKVRSHPAPTYLT